MSGQLNVDPPFGRGQTLGVSEVTAGTSFTGVQKSFVDADPRTSSGQILSNRPVTCLALRNVSGGVVAAGTVVKFKATDILNSFDGVAADATARAGVVDEYLGAAGCANNDVCWVVVSGPTAAKTTATIAAGAPVSVTAGAASASATAADIVGVALAAASGGKQRVLVGLKNGHAI